MSKSTIYTSILGDGFEAEVELDRGPEVVAAMVPLADYIGRLPLSTAERDGLIKLLGASINAAEANAFAEGVRFARDLERAKKDRP